jgi:hypothetical protein
MEQPGWGYDDVENILLSSHPRVRRIMHSPLRPSSSHLLYLHWSNNKPLDDLDRKAERGEVEENDFLDALPALFVTHKCRQCGAYHAMLTEAQGFYEFARDDERRRRAQHVYIRRCPACEKTLYGNVLEIFRLQHETDRETGGEH